MYCRVIRLAGDAIRSDEGIRGWTDGVLPAMKRQPGFAGATLVGNRATGDGLAVSYWETEAAMQDAREQVRPEGLKTLHATGGSIIEDNACEVAVMERIEPAKAGVFVSVTTVQSTPANLSDTINNFKQNVVPALRSQHGVRGAFQFVNPQSGMVFSGSLWDTQADLDKSEGANHEMREQMIQKLGGENARTEAFEVYYTEILTPATVGR
jgi:heme-degrading monooxygenase HmoA